MAQVVAVEIERAGDIRVLIGDIKSFKVLDVSVHHNGQRIRVPVEWRVAGTVKKIVDSVFSMDECVTRADGGRQACR